MDTHGSELIGYISLEGCISARVLVHALHAAGPNPTRRSLIQALEGSAAINVGDLRLGFSADNHQASRQVFMTRLEQGRVVPVR